MSLLVGVVAVFLMLLVIGIMIMYANQVSLFKFFEKKKNNA